MKSGDKVKLNIEEIEAHYLLTLSNTDNKPDYKFVLWANKNKNKEFIVESIIYGNFILLERYDRVFSKYELIKQ